MFHIYIFGGKEKLYSVGIYIYILSLNNSSCNQLLILCVHSALLKYQLISKEKRIVIIVRARNKKQPAGIWKSTKMCVCMRVRVCLARTLKLLLRIHVRLPSDHEVFCVRTSAIGHNHSTRRDERANVVYIRYKINRKCP